MTKDPNVLPIGTPDTEDLSPGVSGEGMVTTSDVPDIAGSFRDSLLQASSGVPEIKSGIPTFQEWYDSNYGDDDDGDCGGHISVRMTRRWDYDRIFNSKNPDDKK